MKTVFVRCYKCWWEPEHFLISAHPLSSDWWRECECWILMEHPGSCMCLHAAVWKPFYLLLHIPWATFGIVDRKADMEIIAFLAGCCPVFYIKSNQISLTWPDLLMNTEGQGSLNASGLNPVGYQHRHRKQMKIFLSNIFLMMYLLWETSNWPLPTFCVWGNQENKDPQMY